MRRRGGVARSQHEWECGLRRRRNIIWDRENPNSENNNSYRNQKYRDWWFLAKDRIIPDSSSDSYFSFSFAPFMCALALSPFLLSFCFIFSFSINFPLALVRRTFSFPISAESDEPYVGAVRCGSCQLFAESKSTVKVKRRWDSFVRCRLRSPFTLHLIKFEKLFRFHVSTSPNRECISFHCDPRLSLDPPRQPRITK